MCTLLSVQYCIVCVLYPPVSGASLADNSGKTGVMCRRVSGASLVDDSGKTGVMSDISISIELYLMCVSPVSVSNSIPLSCLAFC